MVGVGQGELGVQMMDGAVTKREGCFSVFQRAEYGIVGDAPQREDRAQRRHGRDFRDQERATGFLLQGGRLIFRRDTAHGVGDSCLDEGEPVIGAGGKCPPGPAKFDQAWVEQVARIIARKRPSGAVGSA